MGDEGGEDRREGWASGAHEAEQVWGHGKEVRDGDRVGGGVGGGRGGIWCLEEYGEGRDVVRAGGRDEHAAVEGNGCRGGVESGEGNAFDPFAEEGVADGADGVEEDGVLGGEGDRDEERESMVQRVSGDVAAFTVWAREARLVAYLDGLPAAAASQASQVAGGGAWGEVGVGYMV